MNRLSRFWNNLRSSFWFLPSMIVVASIALAVGLIEVDAAVSNRWLAQWPRLFGAGAEGARGMMSTIAGSMMTVVGVTFSMVLMVLAMASGQYTSRILRNFILSRITQVVLGIFAGIFTYCLIVLRTIRSGDEGSFVPNLAVSFGFVLALSVVACLTNKFNGLPSWPNVPWISRMTALASMPDWRVCAMHSMLGRPYPQQRGVAIRNPQPTKRKTKIGS